MEKEITVEQALRSVMAFSLRSQANKVLNEQRAKIAKEIEDSLLEDALMIASSICNGVKISRTSKEIIITMPIPQFIHESHRK